MSEESLFYLAMILFTATLAIWTGFGLGANAKPHYWSSRTTGRNGVRMSRGSLLCFMLNSTGVCLGLTGLAMGLAAVGIAGFIFAGLAFVVGAFFQRSDIRRASNL